MFLSANNFFYKVERQGHGSCGSGSGATSGGRRPALVGVQYVAARTTGEPGRIHRHRRQRRPWAFAGTGLQDGDTFGRYGIEIDERRRPLPPGTEVLARIPDTSGRGPLRRDAYYETPAGAKVFAAGRSTSPPRSTSRTSRSCSRTCGRDSASRQRAAGRRRRPARLLGGARQRYAGAHGARRARKRVRAVPPRSLRPRRVPVVLVDQGNCGKSRPHASDPATT